MSGFSSATSLVKWCVLSPSFLVRGLSTPSAFSPQVMTKDNVNVEIDSVICWKITSPYRATFGILDVQSALVERAQTTLRSVIGARTLQSVVTEREAIANEIEELISEIAEHWGVTVESILIKVGFRLAQ